MKLDEVRLGDTVRLRNGEEILVSDKMTGYTDRVGDHPGPFVATRNFDRYALSDVLEIVTRNERVCRFCGDGVTSPVPEVDYCRNCFYLGRAHQERLAPLIAQLKAIPKVKSANVWHTGGGCFLLAVPLEDGRLIALTDGDAGLPDKGEPWQYFCVAESEEAWDEWDESRLAVHEGNLTDDQLIAAVKEVATAVPIPKQS